MDGAAGIVCSALADRAGLPDTSERTNAVAALKPRPEWVQGKAESRQFNNHLSSANPRQRAQAPEKSQGSRPARTAQPLLGGLREPAARLWPAAAAQCRGAGPQLPGQSGEHALPSQPALRSFTTPSRGIPARTVLRPSARSLSTDDPSPNWTCRGREPDPPDRRLPPSDKWDGYVHLCLHVLGKGAGGGADLTPVFVFRRHPARSRGFGGIYLAFLSPRVRVRHWGDEGQGKGAEGVAAGAGRSEQPAAMLAAVGLGRAERLQESGGSGGGGDARRSALTRSEPGGCAERSETCTALQLGSGWWPRARTQSL
ncbi:uncharacterized protein LOC121044433 isoform X1 [Herpailurus yagouaroundi]|uniref:uncharacterized protein LOC121044433 isoform X1 n=1 Tax=Herpailurus yagouaroundi TaxID=1608482 RepID=UPI001AD78445|nr:uncharacterized protein LOC121044433 isoform X1 [Puma yagouaroundi]